MLCYIQKPVNDIKKSDNFQKNSFMVGKAYLRKKDACNHEKKLIPQ